jgi:AcrR family transcriptional regulator
MASTGIRVARKRPDAYQHGDLRRALIQAGLKLLGEGGVRDLSLRAAAELAGVSHAAPYRHFRDKDALVAAIAEEGFRLLTQRMRDEIERCGSGDVLVRLRASAVGYVAFAVEHPAYFRTIFAGLDCQDQDAAPASLRAAGEEAYAVLRELVSEGIRRGRLRAADPEQLSLAAWSMVHGLGMLIIDGQVGTLRTDPAAARQVTETVVKLLENGLRT